jgi:hypothetical protein
LAAVRYGITLVAVLGALSLAIAGCGSSSPASSSSAAAPGTAATGTANAATGTVKLAKTKFVLHAGLAFGAFHRWIWKPARAGKLAHPFRHPLTAAKAALAAAFVYHELRLALADAQADRTLSKLVAPITALQNRIHALSGSVKSSGASASDANGLDSAVSSIKGQSASAGQPIAEQTPSSPSG